MTTKEFPKLPKSVRELAALGVYSVYHARHKDRECFILVTSSPVSSVKRGEQIFEILEDGSYSDPSTLLLKDYDLIEFIDVQRPAPDEIPNIHLSSVSSSKRWNDIKGRLVDHLFRWMEHGDAEHRAWLKNELAVVLNEFDPDSR